MYCPYFNQDPYRYYGSPNYSQEYDPYYEYNDPRNTSNAERDMMGMKEDILMLKGQSDMQKHWDAMKNPIMYFIRVKGNKIYAMNTWFDAHNPSMHFKDSKTYLGFGETLMSTINITLKDDFGVWHSFSKLK